MEMLADQVKAPEGNVGGEGLNGQWGTQSPPCTALCPKEV